MLRYLAVRALRGAATLWLVVTVVFVGLRLDGGPARALLPDDASAEQIAAFRRADGLDDATPLQYARYLGALARGQFGDSLQERRPVLELVGGRIGATLELGLAAVGLALLLGLPAGAVVRPLTSISGR